MRRQLGRGGYLLLYLAALGISGWFLVTRLERAVGDVQAERATDVETVRTELSLSMVAAQGYVELLQKTVQNEFAVRPSAAPGSILLNALKVDQNGVFSLDELPPSIAASTVGNLTGFCGLRGRGDSFQRELEIALSLRSAFNQIVVNLPSVAWVYYVSGNRFEHVYPWVPSTEAAYKDNDLLMEYFLRGLPENNPERAPYLTDIYDDTSARGS